MKSKRIKWLDFGKGFTIFCVVLFHSLMFNSFNTLPHLVHFLSFFMMPVFFGISGYLYSRCKSIKNYFELIYKKLVGFSVPYISFAFIMLYMYKCKYHFAITNDGHSGGDPHYNNIFEIIFVTHFSYLWFIYILLLIFLLYGSIDIILSNSNRYVSLLSIIIIILIITAVYFYWNGFINFIFWLACFYIGFYLKHTKYLIKINNNNKYKILLLSGWLMLVIICNIILHKYYYSNLFSMVLHDLIELTSILPFFVLFMNWKHNFIFSYFSKYGRYSLIIYLIHFPICLILVRWTLLKRIFIYNDIVGIAITFITWELCIIACNIVRNLPIIKFFLYPREYIDKLLKKTRIGYKLLK